MLQIFKAGDIGSFISPNPSRDFLKIDFEGKLRISIWDPMTNSMVFPTIGEDQMINVSFLRPGIYFIAAETPKRRFIQKFVKL